MNLAKKKYLIAYFFRKGENYVSGRIVDLKVGNTEVVANRRRFCYGDGRIITTTLQTDGILLNDEWRRFLAHM